MKTWKEHRSIVLVVLLLANLALCCPVNENLRSAGDVVSDTLKDCKGYNIPSSSSREDFLLIRLSMGKDGETITTQGRILKAFVKSTDTYEQLATLELNEIQTKGIVC